MYKPYIRPVSEALPDIKMPAPHISRMVLFAVRIVGRIYLFFALGIARVVVRNGIHLFKAYQKALEGKSRCIIAFRHPNGGEAQILMWFILFKLRAKARRAGILFCRKPSVSFVYGYEVARWGGRIARWIMSGLGAMPVYHTKIDSAGMIRIFRAIADGPYPLAIAPEGQVSYTTESVPRLEQGTIRIGFQAAERLAKESDCPVEILPVSIHFRYGSMGRWSLNKLIRKIEKYTGLHGKEKTGFTQRMERARDCILTQNEKRYGLTIEDETDFVRRVDAVMEAALARAESILGTVPKSGDLFERLYHIRQLSWDKMIIPGVTSINHLTLLERSLLDLQAGEAWYASRHMELVDFAWYFRVPVPADDAPLYVKIEYAQNLWDFANRTMGGAYSNRVLNVHPKRVLIQIAPPLNLSERLPAYRQNKKETIGAAMKDMEAAFLDCIDQAAEYQI